MTLGDIHAGQWVLGGLAAVLVGISKTGLPGIGILVVPMMASAFGARASVGILLPVLIVTDCLAVLIYRRHAQWDKLLGLVPFVGLGLLLGAATLWAMEHVRLGAMGGKELFAPLIGGIVMLMILLHLLRRRLGERITPHSRLGVAAAGAATGFATSVANAAGPIMSVYLAGKRLPKVGFMGTSAWFFLLLNLSKLPLYLALDWLGAAEPLIDGDTLLIDACLVLMVLPGVLLGRWMLPRLSQEWFNQLVLWLAGLSALKLILSPVLGW